MTIIFSLAAAFSGTIAWFANERAATVTTGAFSVVAPEGLIFDIYYLNTFTDEEEVTQQGNYNATLDCYSGYEVDYEDANFAKINFEDEVVVDVPDPTNVRHLWPAHKLTYAIVITSSTLTGFTLSNWSEGEGHELEGAAKVDEDTYVRLSWAIDIYGVAYSVQKTENVLADIANGYKNNYFSAEKNSVFNYSEALPADEEEKEILDIIDDVPVNPTGYRTIVYFTIEFSNDEDTFYRYNKTTGYYNKSTSGNSNCYEGLALTSLEFSLI